MPDAASIVVLTIAVNLAKDDSDSIHQVCVEGRPENCDIISADGGVDVLAAAWAKAGERLTVSQKVEQKDLSSQECRRLLSTNMRLESREPAWSMIKQAQWVRYLHRRCHILRSSSKFDKNESLERFGSTTMRIMLEEAEHALSDDYRHDWSSINHEQFVYWEEDGDMRWSLIATKPSALDEERRDLLQTLGMHVPTEEDLRDRRVLDSYLARGLGIELQNKHPQPPFEMDIGTLEAIDSHRFVLTLDFTMKMLCMNERTECGVPCVMEGETGVSKTALTRMLFILKNTASSEADSMSSTDFPALRHSIHEATKQMLDSLSPQQREAARGSEVAPDDLLNRILQRIATSHLNGAAEQEIGCPSAWAQYIVGEHQNVLSVDPDSEIQHLREMLLAEVTVNPGLDCVSGCNLSVEAIRVLSDVNYQGTELASNSLAELLIWYLNAILAAERRHLSWTFHQLNVHAALTPKDIVSDLTPIIERAERLEAVAKLLDSEKHRRAKLCVFLDEVRRSVKAHLV